MEQYALEKLNLAVPSSQIYINMYLHFSPEDKATVRFVLCILYLYIGWPSALCPIGNI